MNNDTRYLEYKLAELREREERRQEEERRAWEQHDRERREEMDQRMRTADNWPEALRKQIYLFGREIAQEAAENAKWGLPPMEDDELDKWFIDGKAACERALQIWAEVDKAKAEKRAELERQIAALEDELKREVALKLESENKRPGWLSVAQAILTEDPENWLQW